MDEEISVIVITLRIRGVPEYAEAEARKRVEPSIQDWYISERDEAVLPPGALLRYTINSVKK